MTPTDLNKVGDRHHVVVVGGGFGGIQCIKSLKRANVRITLIDQRNHHLFQPLLYQVATTILAPSEIAWPLRQVFRDRKDVTTLLATVAGVHHQNKRVLLSDDTSIHYDTLVLATGARHSYFGHPEWEQNAPGLKTLEDATTIRRCILSAFEAAERTDDPELQRAHLTFAVIGAGPTGVELAGIIAELSHRILPREFRRIDTNTARILLIEAGPKVLPTFPQTLSDYAARALSKLGVEILLGDPVTACHATAVEVGETIIPCETIIWAAGVQASPAANWLQADHDRAGRVLVRPDLTVPRHDEIFVIGDTASVNDAHDNHVPGIAPAAKQMGAHVGGLCCRDRPTADIVAVCTLQDVVNAAQVQRRSS
ncbi:NAD(P)/FAD-dependent oxidoreductase [Sedimentitalea todarodis]|uniref:NADH:ubiquinone reductase (non-electrogenic) n=1 Tax=Sedimentitalea todarodis TaxID=1631240 RepID=A0ABU3VLL6_9RHOB|nr:NAD(P)/FAD-dependent oxidoreductase [Sedimentitalea todarodis]MDU9007082.1 NAD(P)/FAD-dependent oxidoreductase [Sedimentitalea todarodis]